MHWQFIYPTRFLITGTIQEKIIKLHLRFSCLVQETMSYYPNAMSSTNLEYLLISSVFLLEYYVAKYNIYHILTQTLLFVWLALSGWLFRIFIFSTFVLPFAAPLLLGTFANRVAIEGSCPACKRRFVGYRNQVIRCMNCQNIVWQPNTGSSGGAGRSRSSGQDVIDVEFEEK